MTFKEYLKTEINENYDSTPDKTNYCYCDECDEIYDKSKNDVVIDENCPKCGKELIDMKELDDDDCIYDDEEYYDDNEDVERLDEITAKRKKVVRDGKRKIKWVCPTGYRKKGRTCVRMSASDRRDLSIRSKRSARKSRSKRASAIRKRKISNRKRY